MNELLSNDEIESLMQMVNSGVGFGQEDTIEEIGVGSFGPQGIVSPVDLLEPNRVSKEHLSGLKRLFHGSAKSIGSTMSEQLRYPMHCDCVEVEQKRFGPWLDLAENHAAIYVLRAPPLDTPLFFTVSGGLLHGWVDRVLGGHGRIDAAPESFSAAEFAVADAFLSTIFDRLAESLVELAELRLEIADRFTNLAPARLIPAQDVVLSVHFQAGSDLLLGDLRLAIACSAIEPFVGRLDTSTSKPVVAPGAMREALTATVQAVDLNVSVDLGRTEMRLRDLLALRVGDVVALRQRAEEPMIAPVEGVPKFSGRVGRIGPHLGFRIASLLE